MKRKNSVCDYMENHIRLYWKGCFLPRNNTKNFSARGNFLRNCSVMIITELWKIYTPENIHDLFKIQIGCVYFTFAHPVPLAVYRVVRK